MKKARWLPVVWLAIMSMSSTSSPAATQTAVSATVTGTVRDQSGAVMMGAAVEIRNQATNQAWRTASDARGRFTVLYLPVGDYRLSIANVGFSTATAALTLEIGDQVDVPVTLMPAAVNESIEVTAAAPLVEARQTEIAETITPAEVDSLPLNGRNYLDLALLAPSVSRTNTRNNDRFAETSAVPGTGISVAGQRNLGNAFIVDGLSANDDAADLAGAYYSSEVVREFEVITSGGVAEFGRASSGTINVVTQSGTNEMHGRVYEFFRDEAFDAKNPLAARKDPLRQHQFGVTFGGPLVKDRTFWFANIERTTQDRTGIVTIAPGAVAAVNRVLDAVGYGGPRIATGEFATGYHTTNLFGRVDHEARRGSRLQLRYALYGVGSPNARNAGGLNDVSRGTRLDDRDQMAAVNYLLPFSSSAINEARAQWSRSRLGAAVNDLVGPAVNISGAASWGTASFSPTARDLDVVEAIDTVTFQRGVHLFKAGAAALYNRVNIEFPGALQGAYAFQSLANFERGTYSTFQQAFGAASQFQSNPNFGLFAQDEWRPRSTLTVNAGLRYDLQWLPAPIELDRNNLSPRLGIAYAPRNGRTVIRASGGVYFDRIPLRATSNALQRDGSKYKTAVLAFGQAGAPVFPAVLRSFPSGLFVSVSTINAGIRSGYSRQASAQVEQAIGNALSASAGYSYLRGRAIIMQRNVNVPTLTVAQAAALGVPNLGRPNPLFGNITQYDALGDSWFNGFTLSMTSRPARWGSARVSYTLSRALDDSGNAFFSTPQDNFNILDDKGPSDNDQRHRLVVSGTFEPRIGGVQVGYMFASATGVSFNPVTGDDRNNDTTVNDRPEGVGRNSARQPSTSSFDLRVSRVFPIKGTHHVEVMVEAFNLFNHVNVVNVNNTFGTGPTPLPTFGQPVAAADARQLQLGVRWSF